MVKLIFKISNSYKTKYLFIWLVGLLISAFSFSQNQNDNQLANRYFNDRDYEKAAPLYEKIYKETKYKGYKDMYLRCLFEMKDLNTAENFVKKELKKNSNDFYLKIDLGMTYLYQNRIKEAGDLFTQVIDYVKNNKNNVQGVAIAFQNYRQFEFAEKTYNEGTKFSNSNFDYELGNLYYIQHDYKKMMSNYINMVENGDNTTLSTVQARLQSIFSANIDGDDINEIIETSILERLQKKPDNINLSNLLIWQYIQIGRYKLALNQLIAIDKRTNKNDLEILDFAKVLKNNNEYNLAYEAVNYLLAKGTESRLYTTVYIENLDISYKKITTSPNSSTAELTELEKNLTNGINLVLKRDSYSIIYSLATIKAFYLNKYDEAINLINNKLEENIFTNNQKLEIKLLLADIYFLSGNQWDATLYYAQVEKAALESPLGHEARFKKAKLAYYVGQFRWAQAQLDVLKASTSKLIANDALELSIFISENYDLDTTETTMQIFARADFLIFSKQYEKALQTLDSVLTQFPMSSLTDDAYFRKAQIYEETGKLQEAAEFYDKIITNYYFDILADNSLFRYALIQDKLKNFEKADDAYFKLISDYPSSIFTTEAREKLRSKRY